MKIIQNLLGKKLFIELSYEHIREIENAYDDYFLNGLPYKELTEDLEIICENIGHVLSLEEIFWSISICNFKWIVSKILSPQNNDTRTNNEVFQSLSTSQKTLYSKLFFQDPEMVMCQHFSGHVVKQQFAAVRN